MKLKSYNKSKEDWGKYALARGKVINTVTGKTGNLNGWHRGKATVCVGIKVIGMVRMPIWEEWEQSETQKVID